MNALFRWCREAGKYMLKKHRGSIVNLSSCCGMRPVSGCAYSTSKGAVNTLTQNLAFRYVDSGIRVNAVCPGRVMTPLQNKAKEQSRGELVNMHTWGDAYVNRSITPLTVDGQAWAALFLASDLMSGDITGVILPVDGGSYMP